MLDRGWHDAKVDQWNGRDLDVFAHRTLLFLPSAYRPSNHPVSRQVRHQCTVGADGEVSDHAAPSQVWDLPGHYLSLGYPTETRIGTDGKHDSTQRMRLRRHFSN